MSPWTIHAAAEQDLQQLVERIGKSYGVDAAQLELDRFAELARRLAADPELGHERPDLVGPDVRCHALHTRIGTWVVLYRIAAEGMVVLRVVAGLGMRALG